MDADCEKANKEPLVHGVSKGIPGVLYLRDSYKLPVALFLLIIIVIFFFVDIPALQARLRPSFAFGPALRLTPSALSVAEKLTTSVLPSSTAISSSSSSSTKPTSAVASSTTKTSSTTRPSSTAVKVVSSTETSDSYAFDGEEDEEDGRNVTGFRKRFEVRHIDCAKLFAGDQEYIKTVVRNRPAMLHREHIDMSCDAIKARVLPVRNNNTGFPIAFAKIVYMDYLFLEEQLAATYAEENTYCFVVDKKAPDEFHRRFEQLAQCLSSNVVVAPSLYTIDQAGHNQNLAHMECMKLISNRKWNYIMLLQNHDMIIKTHQQMTEIFKIYDGANDIEEVMCPADRCGKGLETNLGKLQLCPIHLPPDQRAHCEHVNLKWGKGMMQLSLSRAAVEYIFNDLNITALHNELNAMGFGVDEELFETLNLNPELRLPGGFTTKCLGSSSEFMSRYTIWFGACKTNYKRHAICMLGVEQLKDLDTLPNIMANKMMPEFDYAAITCIGEMLYNRTRGWRSSALFTHHYENINLVRYHKAKKQPGFNEQNFPCHVSRK